MLTFLVVAALAAAAAWIVAEGVPLQPVPLSPDAASRDPVRTSRPGPSSQGTVDTDTDTGLGITEPPPPLQDVVRWRGDQTIDRRVVDEDGVTPVAGVTVTLLVTPPPTPTNRRPQPIRVATTVTGADGRFRFEGLARRSFQVRVEAHHRSATMWSAYAGGRPERRARGSGLASGDMRIGRDVVVHFVLVDEQGEAVRRAVGEVLGPRTEPLATVTCDDRGRADWLPSEDDGRVVVFRAPGLATEVVWRWNRGQDTRVVMRPGNAIAGVVVDEEGHPVHDADVSIRLIIPLGEAHVVTGPDGAFRFEALHAYATMPVTVRRNDGPPTVVSTPTGREDVRIVLPPAVVGGTVRGIVLRPDGTPAAGAIVDLTVTCDAGGRFEIHSYRDGDIAVGARYGTIDLPMPPHRWHTEFGRADLRLPRGGEVGGVTVLLHPAPVSFVPVRLTDADDAPLAGVAVGATRGATGSGGFGGVTDADGRAVVAFVDTPAGTTVTVGIGGVTADTTRQSAEVVTRTAWDGPPERVVVEDALRVTVEIAGVAEDEWGGVKVWAYAHDRFHNPVGTRVGEGPEFEIGVLDQGEHLVMIGHPRGGAFGIVPAGGRERRLHVDVRRGATLRVTITDADGETPRGLRRVALFWERAAPAGFVTVGGLRRGDDGEWTGEHLFAGRFLLAVDRGRLPSAIVPVVVRETGTNTVHVTLPRPRTVSGEVRGAASEPLGGCVVSLRLPGGRRPADRFGPLATTGADGRFEVTLEPIDGAYLAFEREGHATRMVPIDGSLAERAHRVALERAGTILVRTGYVAAARLPGTDVVWEPYVEPSTASPPPGGTPLRRLPAGDVELITIGGGGTPVVHTVRVVPGRTVVLDLGAR